MPRRPKNPRAAGVRVLAKQLRDHPIELTRKNPPPMQRRTGTMGEPIQAWVEKGKCPGWLALMKDFSKQPGWLQTYRGRPLPDPAAQKPTPTAALQMGAFSISLMARGEHLAAILIMHTAIQRLDNSLEEQTEADYMTWHGELRFWLYKVFLNQGAMPNPVVLWTDDRPLRLFRCDVALQTARYAFYGDLCTGTDEGLQLARRTVPMWGKGGSHADLLRLMEAAQRYYCHHTGQELIDGVDQVQVPDDNKPRAPVAIQEEEEEEAPPPSM